MGQDRQESLRIQYLIETELWAFPVSEWERATAAELLQLPSIRVTRIDAGFLAGLGMVAKQCHHNATSFKARMEQQGVRVLSGWIRKARVLTLHSIVQLDGRYYCVTPTPGEADLEFDFIPDPALEVASAPGGFSLERGGVPLGIGLRCFPDRDQPWFAMALARLKSGMDPEEAIRFDLPGRDRVTSLWRGARGSGQQKYDWRRRLG